MGYLNIFLTYLLGTTLSVSKSLVCGGEDTSGLYNILSTSTGPVDSSRIPLVEHGDLVSVHVQELAVLLDLALELTVGGVILEHVDHVVKGDEGIIDGNNLQIKNNFIYYFNRIIFHWS